MIDNPQSLSRAARKTPGLALCLQPPAGELTLCWASHLFGEGEGGRLEGGVNTWTAGGAWGGGTDLGEVSAPFVTSERAIHDCALKDVFFSFR